MLKAVWFDMDDTLISINLSAFIYVYAKDHVGLLAQIARRSALALVAPFSASYLAMFDENRTDDLTNREYFNAEIERRCGIPLADPVIADVFTCYEQEVLPRRNDRLINAHPRRGALEALEKVVGGGYRTALITNPSFSQTAIECRMRWGGIADAPFERVTHMENSRRCKPDANYYQENLDLLGLRADEVLMVGNDPKRDFPLPNIGLKTAYVGNGSRPGAFWSGSMEEFARNFEQIAERFNEEAASQAKSCAREEEAGE